MTDPNTTKADPNYLKRTQTIDRTSTRRSSSIAMIDRRRSRRARYPRHCREARPLARPRDRAVARSRECRTRGANARDRRDRGARWTTIVDRVARSRVRWRRRRRRRRVGAEDARARGTRRCRDCDSSTARRRTRERRATARTRTTATRGKRKRTRSVVGKKRARRRARAARGRRRGGGGRDQGGVGHRAGVRGRRGRRDGIRSQENAKHTASVGSDPRASREGTAAVAEATRRADAGTEARRGGCENRASQTPETGEGGRRGGEVAGRTA